MSYRTFLSLVPLPEKAPVPDKRIQIREGDAEMVLGWAFDHLKDGNYDQIRAMADLALRLRPDFAQAYLCLLLADMKCSSLQELPACGTYFADNENYRNVLRCGDESLCRILNNYALMAIAGMKADGGSGADAKAMPAGQSVKPGAAGTGGLSQQNVKVGSLVPFGIYVQEGGKAGHVPMEWLVLAVENGKALLLSRYLLNVKPFHKEMTAVSWKDCSLRAWLNGPFLKTAFQEQERKRILPTDIKTPNNPKFKTEGGKDTTDAVFLLSMQEAEKYLPTEAERACKTAPELTKDIWNSSTNWWLRTPGSSASSAAVVTGNGYLHAFGNYVSMDGNAVRPAMWIRLS